MKDDLSNWRLHLAIQLTTFLLFPLIVLITYPLIQSEQSFHLWFGIFFLASLPSTVSSSVVMVSIARGNVPAAIFNASFSGLIGILLTPLWIGIFLEARVDDFDLTKIFLELLLKIVLPVLIGMFFHRFAGRFTDRYQSKLVWFDKVVILMIVYVSFSDSFGSGILQGIDMYDLLFQFLGVILLFIAVFYLSILMSSRLHFSIEDRISYLFCGSKKSLVHGSVFSSVLFAGLSFSSIYLVPVMIYHALQLLIISFIAHQYGRR